MKNFKQKQSYVHLEMNHLAEPQNTPHSVSIILKSLGKKKEKRQPYPTEALGISACVNPRPHAGSGAGGWF